MLWLLLIVCVVVAAVLVGRMIRRWLPGATARGFGQVRNAHRARTDPLACARCGQQPRRPGSWFCSPKCETEAEWSDAIR